MQTWETEARRQKVKKIGAFGRVLLFSFVQSLLMPALKTDIYSASPGPGIFMSPYVPLLFFVPSRVPIQTVFLAAIFATFHSRPIPLLFPINNKRKAGPLHKRKIPVNNLEKP
ncbi:hypothetical protein DXF96_08955 [Heyndrickxia coagulans]|jgi:hypothetical protein|uniref:Uncharacterized protein n=1 Tax=Heyndrickxia coagulans TaxID=1398 RepID=A0A0C5C7B1_HEYCO|nr:hypothetical protein SB48_HM08orf05507 [Heyndrickxia coagulans]KGT37688.1 hypothetical protein P421_14065 [Heyndrickxia coagulans P38]ATW84124.1 hypothetical protein CIW84_14630 [Heyndrickxia coagulans]AVD55220.1 hypothetical protein C3766_03265 [Heyndrickxia coagulans]AWP36092.1 hypothetical protein CYJ15_03410 [Heyndrickxia coagulans]